jgi:hypothetical protein
MLLTQGCIINNEPEALRLFEEATRMNPPMLPVALTNTGVMYHLGSVGNKHSDYGKNLHTHKTF